MDLSFHPLSLEAIDQAGAEALCLFVSEDERPLNGLAGLTDWRLAGRLSRMIRAGLVTGASGEALLTPPGARLAFGKLFVFGLGKEQSEAELSARLSDALRRLAKAGVREAALQLPARLPAEVGVRTLMDSEHSLARALLFASEPGKMVTTLSQEASLPPMERRTVKVSPPAPAVPKPEPQRPGQTGPQRYVPPPPKEQKKKRR